MRVEGRDAGGEGIYARIWNYGANGKLKQYEKDENGDGWPDSIETWEYDSSGNLTQHETDNGDGRIFFERWVFDGDGTLTGFERNHDGIDEGVFQSAQYHAGGWDSIFSVWPGSRWPYW